MLDPRNPHQAVERLWVKLGCRIQLPEDEAAFLAKRGPAPSLYHERRKYRRFFYRGKSILTRGGEHFAVYTKDVSRGSILIVHATQLFPRELVRLLLPNGSRLDLRIKRCRKVQANCFECGAEIEGILRDTLDEYSSLLDALAGSPTPGVPS